MKAYIVKEKGEFACEVVFAENAGKAKSIAMSLDCFEGAYFIGLEARRLPEADSQCKGRRKMEWDDPKDRLFLVKNLGLCCEFIEPFLCESCVAQKYCENYQGVETDEK